VGGVHYASFIQFVFASTVCSFFIPALIIVCVYARIYGVTRSREANVVKNVNADKIVSSSVMANVSARSDTASITR
jgi:hypothetical protein